MVDGLDHPRDEDVDAGGAGRPPLRDSWTTLAEYLATLERTGIATNVGVFVGATIRGSTSWGWRTSRQRPSSSIRMRALVRQAMQDGAFGVGTSLILTPASRTLTER